MKSVHSIDEDLRAICKTMKLTYKTITMENEDIDFQFSLQRSFKEPKAVLSATCTLTS